MVKDHAAVWIRLGEGFPQLLHDPFRGRMSGHIAVQNLPPTMLNDQKAVQQFERQSGYR